MRNFRFAVRESAIYYSHGIPYAVFPTDRLVLTGGTADGFYCSVFRGDDVVVGGVEIPIADIERVVVIPNCLVRSVA